MGDTDGISGYLGTMWRTRGKSGHNSGDAVVERLGVESAKMALSAWKIRGFPYLNRGKEKSAIPQSSCIMPEKTQRSPRRDAVEPTNSAMICPVGPWVRGPAPSIPKICKPYFWKCAGLHPFPAMLIEPRAHGAAGEARKALINPARMVSIGMLPVRDPVEGFLGDVRDALETRRLRISRVSDE